MRRRVRHFRTPAGASSACNGAVRRPINSHLAARGPQNARGDDRAGPAVSQTRYDMCWAKNRASVSRNASAMHQTIHRPPVLISSSSIFTAANERANRAGCTACTRTAANFVDVTEAHRLLHGAESAVDGLMPPYQVSGGAPGRTLEFVDPELSGGDALSWSQERRDDEAGAGAVGTASHSAEKCLSASNSSRVSRDRSAVMRHLRVPDIRAA